MEKRFMAKDIRGPKRPRKAFHHLDVNLDVVQVREGLLKGIIDPLNSFDASKGYFNSFNQRVYDTLWMKIFSSLTGEKLLDCLNMWILPEDKYLPKIRKVFGSDEAFYEFTGYCPMDVQGVNLDGTWIIYRDKRNLAMLADIYHEIGHRVYPKSRDRFNHELGANYFMLLALKKANIELEGSGFSLPRIEFREQLTEDHGKALQEARRLIDINEKYVHRVK